MQIREMIERLKELESLEKEKDQLREYTRQIHFHTQEILDWLKVMMDILENEKPTTDR